MKNKLQVISNEQGSVLVFSLLVMTIIMSITFSVLGILLPKLKVAADPLKSVVALYAADSGLEWCLYVNRTAPPPSGNVTFDSSVNSPNLSNLVAGSWTHTTSGTNRYLIVGLAGWDNTSSLINVIISYNGVPMTKLGGAQLAGQNQAVLWGLVNPAIGAHTVAVSNIPAGFAELGGGSISLVSVHQTTPTGTVVNETLGDGSVNLTLASEDLGIDILYSGSGAEEPVIGAGGTKRVNTHLIPNPTKWMMMGTEGGSGPVTMSWTDAGGSDFAQAAVLIKFASAPATIPPPVLGFNPVGSGFSPTFVIYSPASGFTPATCTESTLDYRVVGTYRDVARSFEIYY